MHRFLAATLDGFVNDPDAVFEAKFMLPWSFSEEAAAEKHMAQLQHNMWVTNAKVAAPSIITGGGKWIEMTIPADALYQHFLVTADWSPPSADSGAAFRPAKSLAHMASSRRGCGSRRFASST